MIRSINTALFGLEDDNSDLNTSIPALPVAFLVDSVLTKSSIPLTRSQISGECLYLGIFLIPKIIIGSNASLKKVFNSSLS